MALYKVYNKYPVHIHNFHQAHLSVLKNQIGHLQDEKEDEFIF